MAQQCFYGMHQEALPQKVELLAAGEDGRIFFFPRPSPDGRRLLWMAAHTGFQGKNYDRWDVVAIRISRRSPEQ